MLNDSPAARDKERKRERGMPGHRSAASLFLPRPVETVQGTWHNPLPLRAQQGFSIKAGESWPRSLRANELRKIAIVPKSQFMFARPAFLAEPGSMSYCWERRWDANDGNHCKPDAGRHPSIRFWRRHWDAQPAPVSSHYPRCKTITLALDSPDHNDAFHTRMAGRSLRCDLPPRSSVAAGW
jgi:hypothetical protein